MIIIKPKESLIMTETINNIKNNKAMLLYCMLLSKQQDRIFYESIKEMSKELPRLKAYKTIQKYLKILIEEGLIIKYKGIYFINYLPLKRIK